MLKGKKRDQRKARNRSYIKTIYYITILGLHLELPMATKFTFKINWQINSHNGLKVKPQLHNFLCQFVVQLTMLPEYQ